MTSVLVDPRTAGLREVNQFNGSPAYAWAPDGKMVYGVFLTDAGSELRTLDVVTGSIKTIAKYSSRLRIEDDNNVTIRMVFDTRRQSFITTVVNDRSNVWMLRGLPLAGRTKP